MLTGRSAGSVAQTSASAIPPSPGTNRSSRACRINSAVSVGAASQALTPMGRFGEPEEIAELVAWLSSSAVSFSTGAVFDASGGNASY